MPRFNLGILVFAASLVKLNGDYLWVSLIKCHTYIENFNWDFFHNLISLTEVACGGIQLLAININVKVL